jgi:hypothetical protein
MGSKKIISIVLLAIVPAFLFSAEKVEYKDLPKAVKLVFDKAFGKDKFEFEKIHKSSRYGKSIYKIRGEYVETDDEYDITIYEDGTIFKIERESEEEDNEEDEERNKK